MQVIKKKNSKNIYLLTYPALYVSKYLYKFKTYNELMPVYIVLWSFYVPHKIIRLKNLEDYVVKKKSKTNIDREDQKGKRRYR